MFIKKGPLDVDLELIEQPKEKPRSDSEAWERSFKCKKNVSHFYSEVYAAMTGGEAGPIYKGDRETLSDGLEINFHPDVTKKSRAGVRYTEVKAFSSRSLRISCSLRQIANYSYKLLERITAGDSAPSVDYAFFRYGEWADANLFRLPNEELEKRLCERTKFGVVLPLNLLLFMFYNSHIKNQNQKSSDSNFDSQSYFEMSGGRMFKRLFRGDSTLFDEMKEHFEDLSNSEFSYHFEPEDFMLSEIKHKTFASPKIKVNGKNVQPFDIINYYLPSKQHKSWLNHFKKNHKRILDGVGIEDYMDNLFAREEYSR